MNTAQYGYQPYPSPSQTAQVHSQQLQDQLQQHQQPDALSPSLQHHQHQQQTQQQLSPQQSPVSPSLHSPEAIHSPHSHTSHNGPQSPIDAEGEIILPSPGSSTSSSGHHGLHQIKVESQANPTISGIVTTALSTTTATSSLLPMPSPALAAATAANTAANTNTSASRQAILQQYQQQQHQQQHQQQQQMHMGSLPMGNGTTTINTAMMGLQGPTGYMLPSPISAGTQPLPALPPQSADLDTILAKYASQPELLKLIIASKTEEDRRWAEEARYRMMDLIMRGENRGLGFMAGYEALGGITPGMMGNKRFMEEGYAQHSGFAGFPPTPGGGVGAPGVSAGNPTGGTTVLTSMSSSTTGSSGSMYAPQINAFGISGMPSMMSQGTGGQAFGYVDPSLA
ncbi:hypothetical protein BGZ52_007572, partial [Haplosporangium bisporale]